MNLAIIGAMREEILPILSKFGGEQNAIKHNMGDNIYYEITFKGHKIFVAYSRIGKVFSAISATTMILKFQCQQIIFSGVAGGLSKDLSVGDLLLGSRLVQHDVDLSAFGHPLGFISESSVFVESDDELNSIARSTAKRLGIQLKEGVIASGDEFVASGEKKRWISEQFGAVAVEMEGASVGFCARSFNVPFCVLRSISDSADDEADISFDKFLEHAAQIAADFVFEMAAEVLKRSKI